MYWQNTQEFPLMMKFYQDVLLQIRHNLLPSNIYDV